MQRVAGFANGERQETKQGKFNERHRHGADAIENDTVLPGEEPRSKGDHGYEQGQYQPVRIVVPAGQQQVDQRDGQQQVGGDRCCDQAGICGIGCGADQEEEHDRQACGEQTECHERRPQRRGGQDH